MATKAEIRPFLNEVYFKTDKVIETILGGYFVFGIFLAFFYDTWLVGFGVGTLSIILYFGTKAIYKGRSANQYIASLVLGIFMAQFIYQMHGLFEMHFTALIAVISLMAYQNIYVFIPITLFIVIHHSIFAYIQYIGFSQDIDSYKMIYFTQMDYMDLQTFIFHAGLVAIAVVIAAIYARQMRQRTITSAVSILELRDKDKITAKNIEFANEIAQAHYDEEYELREGDELGQALLNMRDNLKDSSKREAEEKFTNVGLTQIADIIRNNSNDLEELSYQTVSYLVKYMKLNQGGLFVLDSDDIDVDSNANAGVLKLMGCYAYDRRKYLEKSVEPGEGLIGQCFLEKEVIYLKEVPEDYIRITSGLGTAPPNVVIMVPIKTEDVVTGVMELAGFHELADYEISFLQKVGENVATAINSTRITARTTYLYEQSQQQTEEMRAQEEEMRQNMEELQATQEEMERARHELENNMHAINSSLAIIEFTPNGEIITANDNFLSTMGYRKEEIVGKHHRIFVPDEIKNSAEYEKMWDDLAHGRSLSGEFKRMKSNGDEIYLYGIYSIKRDAQGNVSSVMKFVQDINDFKNS